MRTYFLLGTKPDQQSMYPNHAQAAVQNAQAPEQATHLSNPALLVPPTKPRTLAPLHHKPASGPILNIPQPVDRTCTNPTLVVTLAEVEKQNGFVSIQNTPGAHPTPIFT